MKLKNSIEACEEMYVRPRKYDSLLSILFPEMAERLSKKFGTEDYVLFRKMGFTQKTSNRVYLDKSNHSSTPTNRQVGNRSYWLEGRELEQWIRENPTAARNFFVNSGRKNDSE